LPNNTATPFAVNYTLQPGKVVSVEVYADVFSAGTDAVAVNDTITVSLEKGASNAMAQVSYESINLPAASLAGNELTVAQGAMVVAAKSSYPNQSAVFPQNSYKIGEYTVSGSSVEAVDIYEYTLKVTAEDGSDNTNDERVSVRNVYLSINGVNTPIRTQSIVSTFGGTTGTYSFSATNALAKNGTIDIAVYADINTTDTPEGTTTVKSELQIAGTGAESGTTITSDKATGQTITYSAAKIGVTRDASTPVAAIVTGGKEVKTASYKFETQNDAYIINRLSFSIVNPTVVSQVKLMKGSTLLAQMPGAAIVTFAGINHSIPANTSEVLDVVLVLSNVGTGAGQTGANVTTQLLNDAADTRVRVIPASTGIIGNIDDGEITAGNEIRVYKSVPTIELASLSSTQLTFGTRTLQRFTVSADSAGSISWNQIKFDISKASTALFSTVALYETGTSTAIEGTFTESGDLSTSLGDGGDGSAISGTLNVCSKNSTTNCCRIN